MRCKLSEHLLLEYRRRRDSADHRCKGRSCRCRGGLTGCCVVLKKKSAKHFCELRTVADGVPITVLRLRRLDESSLIGRVNVRLVCRIPVIARQPTEVAVLDSD